MIAFTIACLLPTALVLALVPIAFLAFSRKGGRVAPRGRARASGAPVVYGPSKPVRGRWSTAP